MHKINVMLSSPILSEKRNEEKTEQKEEPERPSRVSDEVFPTFRSLAGPSSPTTICSPQLTRSFFFPSPSLSLYAMSFPKPISLPSSPGGGGGGLAPPGSNPGSFTPASSIPNIPLRVPSPRPSPNSSGVQTFLGERRPIPLAGAALGGLGEASGLSTSLQQRSGSGALAADAGPSGALTPNSVTR